MKILQINGRALIKTEPSTSSLVWLEHKMQVLNAKDGAEGYDRDQATKSLHMEGC